MHWYNENDPNAAAWLRELIARGHLPAGVVDERSIADVQPGDLEGFVQCHFFAGIGGWPYALRLALWPDDRPVWTGSCPCQPFSAAGKRKGFDDDRHLWPVFRNLIEKCRPPVIFGEQVAAAAQWLGLVRGDLEALGYAVGAMPVEAASAGADHLRDRFWFVAMADAGGKRGTAGLPASPRGREGLSEVANDSGGGISLAHPDQLGQSQGREQRSGQLGRAGGDPQACDGVDVAEPGGDGAERGAGGGVAPEGAPERIHWRASRSSFAPRLDGQDFAWVIGADGKARRVEPGVRLLVDGFPHRVGLLRGFGNAIDPRPAAAFIKAASECLT